MREEETIARVRAIFEAEMDAPTDPGTHQRDQLKHGKWRSRLARVRDE